ncbi:MAG TPA: LuxR C-terminal-related transcriptional regulator [Spirochaetia bacterium]|nr:LuxR C-terminal-related transcriptional regulator [Spirochaetia bacterium]
MGAIEERLPWRAILDYLAEVETAQTLDRFLVEASCGLEKLIPSDVEVGFFHVNGPCLCQTGAGESVRRAYAEYYQYHLPWFEQGHKGLPSYLVGVQVVDLKRIWGDTEFGTDFLPMTGSWKMMSSTFLSHSYVVNLTRSRLCPDFSEVEQSILSVVTPHINNLYSIFNKLGSATDQMPPPEMVHDALPVLSGREAEVVALLSRGLTAAEIATRLFISKRTVDAHVAHVYDKLDIKSRSALRHKLSVALRPVGHPL